MNHRSIESTRSTLQVLQAWHADCGTDFAREEARSLGVPIKQHVANWKINREWRLRLYSAACFKQCIAAIDAEKGPATLNALSQASDLCELLGFLRNVTTAIDAAPNPRIYREFLDAPKEQGQSILAVLESLTREYPAYAEVLTPAVENISRSMRATTLRHRPPATRHLAAPSAAGRGCADTNGAWRAVAVRSFHQFLPKEMKNRYAAIAKLCAFVGFDKPSPALVRSIVLGGRT